MQCRGVYLSFILLLGSCGAFKPSSQITEHKKPTTISERLKHLATVTQSWAQYCNHTVSKDSCDTGDAALFGGLACSAGDEKACQGVALAQDETGRWWRSEQGKGVCTRDCFSRDMMLGVLVYLATKKDKAAAEKWLSYIKSHDHKLCGDDTDGRCIITPSAWGLFGIVWSYLGLVRDDNMKSGEVLDQWTFELSARHTDVGFALHLVGVSAYLKFLVGKNTNTTRKAARILAKRQPENPFFRYLGEGANDPVAELLLSKCPLTQPVQRTQWAWERDTASQAWQHSMGHDCLFLVNLLTSKPALPKRR